AKEQTYGQPSVLPYPLHLMEKQGIRQKMNFSIGIRTFTTPTGTVPVKHRHNMKCFTTRNYLLLLAVAIWLGGASCSRYFVPRAPATYTEVQIDSTIADDPAYLAFYSPYKEQLEAEMNRVVGRTAVSLTKPRDEPETL